MDESRTKQNRKWKGLDKQLEEYGGKRMVYKNGTGQKWGRQRKVNDQEYERNINHRPG